MERDRHTSRRMPNYNTDMYSTPVAAKGGPRKRTTPQSGRRLETMTVVPRAAANNANAESEEEAFSLTYEQREQVSEIFDAIDREGRGYISTTRLKEVMRSLRLPEPNASVWDLWMREIDLEASGKLSRDVLEHFIAQRYAEVSQDQNIESAFRLFKPDVLDIANAKITLADLQRVSLHLGEHIPDTELMEMIGMADIGDNGGVGIEDFKRIMRKTGLF
ncbi:hypothetical protein GGI07_000180 [Coemansia sp. Benny D115]|nr:hypothetical protein GGI07_000180 [Coemansia sp. Benny D115]